MTITREQILESLHTDWGTFVDRFQRLSPEAQAVYLQQQGYARLPISGTRYRVVAGRSSGYTARVEQPRLHFALIMMSINSGTRQSNEP